MTAPVSTTSWNGRDSLETRRTLEVGGRSYDYFSLKAAEKTVGDMSRLPFSLKVLLENMLRFEDWRTVTVEDIKAIGAWLENKTSDREIQFRPSRVLMQDFTGVPAVCDLAAMRDSIKEMGGKASQITPLVPVDLVIDHSVMVDAAGSADAFNVNVELEFERNRERYSFLRWGQSAFRNFRVVPPGTGICHQVNLEYLAQVCWVAEDTNSKKLMVYPDTLVGTDSHTTMINALAVLGWGVGGIEAEAAMLDQPVSMLIPEVVGFKLSGTLKEGTTATDLVLSVTQMLRAKKVVGKFVEFYGPGLDALSLADRATISNMAPEYGATCGFFPVDKETIRYLEFTGRDPERVKLVELYAKEQGLWRDETTPDPSFTDTLELDLSVVEPALAGPRRPQDRVLLSNVAADFNDKELTSFGVTEDNKKTQVQVADHDYVLSQGDVVIAAITSCTNTSNPSVMIAAGLVAKKAVARGLKVKPWVKTSLAPGSQVVTEYLNASSLTTSLDELGFQLVGYGCATCIGNSGPLPEVISNAIEEGNLVAAGVLSGNRNFEGRIQPFVKANYLASPPLVVAYALLGNIGKDITTEPLGLDRDGQPVYLRDIWPTNKEVADTLNQYLTPDMFRKRYANVFVGPEQWQVIATSTGETYGWENSTYVKQPPFFSNLSPDLKPVKDILGAKALAILGDSVTTDHISPAGNIKRDSPAGAYLIENGVTPMDFNSYGARRGNHEVMMRGTFANIRIRNEMIAGTEGGVTRYLPNGEIMPIYDAAMKYQADQTPLIIIAGQEYGTGSSRDWAAKGTYLLGVKAVLAESFERIHRSNLVGMGVLPLQFLNSESRKTLALDGSETFDIRGLEGALKPHMELTLVVTRKDKIEQHPVMCRIDTLNEIEYYKNSGILQYVLRNLSKGKVAA